MPDGSYRKTYATTSKTYLDCLEIHALSKTFDTIDSAMMNVLSKFNQHYSKDQDSTCNELAYNIGERRVPIENSIEKEHIHVYTKNPEKTTHLQKNEISDNLVPYHVDNGLFLIITPFPKHGMSVKLSNGLNVSTNNVLVHTTIVKEK